MEGGGGWGWGVGGPSPGLASVVWTDLQSGLGGPVSVGEAIKGWVVASTGGRVDRGVVVVWGSTCGSSGGGGCRWGSVRSGVRVGVGRGGCKGRRGAGVRALSRGPRRGLVGGGVGADTPVVDSNTEEYCVGIPQNRGVFGG